MDNKVKTMTKEEKLNKLSGWMLQEDAVNPFSLFLRDDLTIEEYISHRFANIPSETVSAILWDCGFESEAWKMYLKGTLPLRDVSTIERWAAEGVDFLENLEKETHKRGMLALWNHRISEVDLRHPMDRRILEHPVPFEDKSRTNYLKEAHPDWVVKCWWPQGLWNLANKELRAHKLKILREIMENYELDGMQLDFARHTPCLPPGSEWENREEATAFVREVRTMLDEVGEKQKRPLLLLARVGENIPGNHQDGLEVERWMEEELVDVLVPGGRTVHIDFESFRKHSRGKKIKIIPSWDAHHTGKGMHRPPAEYLHAVMQNFTDQGADGASLFNVTEEEHQEYADLLKMPFRKESFLKKKKEYRAERRGEYPWAGNYIYRSDDKPLPLELLSGEGKEVMLEIYSDVPAKTLSLMVEKCSSSDIEKVELNGIEAIQSFFDPARPDAGGAFARTSKIEYYPAFDYDVSHIPLRKGFNSVMIRFKDEQEKKHFTIVNVFLTCEA